MLGLAQKNSPFPIFFCKFRRNRPKFSCLLDHANVIAAAAAAGKAHGAVTSAITHVAVTAVAIASGACLSTKVDFLWPKLEEQPGILHVILLFLFIFVQFSPTINRSETFCSYS